MLVFQVNRPCTLSTTCLTFLRFNLRVSLSLSHPHIDIFLTTIGNIFRYSFTLFVLYFMFVLQIIGGFPFTTDIALITGTDLESFREEERVTMLTGFTTHFFTVCKL